MISADAFLGPARAAGFDFYTGVPCSFLTPIINRVSGGAADYMAAASEGEAVAIASGAWLAGHETVVMCQNSGLGNAVNPLTSLNFPFRIPTLMIVTWRAGPGLKDEPQHELMGAITPGLLDLIRVAHRPFPASVEAVAPALEEARREMGRTGLAFAFIMEKGSVADDGFEAGATPPPGAGEAHDLTRGGPRPARIAAIESLLAVVPGAAAVIATTGKCGRELFTLADREQHLYQVGSMGCAAAMGLGVALNVERPVVVLDGDGAALMKLGTLATIGACAPANLVHIVLDNETYESTGGQPTVSPGVDFAAAALACGYRRAFTCDDLSGLETAAKSALAAAGPSLIHARIARGSMKNLGRPTMKPFDVARRFKQFLSSRPSESASTDAA